MSIFGIPSFGDIFDMLEDWLIPEMPEQPTGTELIINPPASNPLIYGKVKNISGVIVDSRVVNPPDKDDIPNDLLYIQVVWSAGAIGSIDQIYLNDTPIQDERYDDKNNTTSRWVFWYDSPYGYDSYLGDQTFKGKGQAFSIIRLEWNSEKMQSLPKITADITGRLIKRVDDLESSAVYPSDNYADIIYDYLTNPDYGRGLNPDRIDVDSFIAERQFMETLVYPFPDSPAYQKLMTCNIRLDCSANLLDNLNVLRKGCRGFLPYVDGVFKFIVERERDPLTFEITDSNTMSDFIVEDNEIKDHYNKVIVSYPDRDQKGQAAKVEYPEDNTDLLIEDSYLPLQSDVNLETVNNYYEALQAAEIILKRSRNALRVKVTTKPTDLLVGVGYVINVSNSQFGMVNKPFLITSLKFNPEGLISFELLEYQESIYPWNVKPEQVIPDTSVVDYTVVPAVTNLRIEKPDDGTAQIVVKWDSPHKSFYLTLDGARLTDTGNTFKTLNNLVQGGHTVNVRAINGLGYSSPVSSLIFTVTNPEIPTIDYTVDNFNIEVFPVIAGSYLGVTFQLLINTANDLDTAQDKGRAGSFTIAGLSPNTVYYLWLRTINVAGVSGWASVSVKTLNDNTELVEFLDIDTESIVDDVVDELRGELDSITGSDFRQDVVDKLGSIFDTFNNGEDVINETQIRKTETKTLDGKIEDNSAAITETNQVIVDLDEATATRFVSVEASVNNNSAEIVRVEQAYVSADEAIALRIDSAEVEIDNNTARWTLEQTARVDGDSALASSISQLEADTGNTYATITRVDQVESNVNGNTSAISGLTTRVGNAEGDIADSQLILSSHSSELGELSARAFLGTTIVNGDTERVTGIVITDGSGNETTKSTIEFRANTIQFSDNDGNIDFYYDGTKNKFVFNGELSAATGTFTGKLIAAEGSFEGDISGSNGEFTGTVRAANIIGEQASGQSTSISFNSSIPQDGSYYTIVSWSTTTNIPLTTASVKFLHIPCPCVEVVGFEGYVTVEMSLWRNNSRGSVLYSTESAEPNAKLITFPSFPEVFAISYDDVDNYEIKVRVTDSTGSAYIRLPAQGFIVSAFKSTEEITFN